MKKSDLIKLIREIVRQEIKKELPNALAQWFALNVMGQSQQSRVQSIDTTKNLSKNEQPVSQPQIPADEVDKMASLKSQLQEMFNGGAPIQKATSQQTSPQQKRFTSNPVLNEILNQTKPFNNSERMANRVGGGGAAVMSPGVAMAAAQFTPAASTTGVGEMMSESDLEFMKNVPSMPGANDPVLTELPACTAPVLQEGQEGGPAPMEGMAIDSALDLKNHPALPDSIKNILSRDYRSLVRAMDKKK